MSYGNLPLPPQGTFDSTALMSPSTSIIAPSTCILTKAHTKSQKLITAFKQRLYHQPRVSSPPPAPYSLTALGIKKRETRDEEDIYLNDPDIIIWLIVRDNSAINLRTHPLTSFPERLQNVRVVQKLFLALRARIDDFCCNLKLMPLRKTTGEKDILLDAIACLKFYEMCWVVIVGWQYNKNWMAAVDFLAGDMRGELEISILALTDGLRERKELLRVERDRSTNLSEQKGDEARLALRLRR